MVRRTPVAPADVGGVGGGRLIVPLRIGFDMDGVFADFASAYREVEERLFGAAAPRTRAGDSEDEAGAQEKDGARAARRMDEMRRRSDVIWNAIQSTPEFWTTLRPIDPGAVARLHALAIGHKWDVFFLTQRPATAGQSVQRQTQHWLAAHGFDLPSVLVVSGSRGAAAAALQLDYHIDDSALHCIDVKSESAATPILIVRPDDDAALDSARRLGVGTVSSIAECLDLLDRAVVSRAQPGLLQRLAQFVGWQ